MKDHSNMGPHEIHFWDAFEPLHIELESKLQRAVHGPEKNYVYKMTYQDGTIKTGMVPWDLYTYINLLKIAKGEM